MTFDAVTREQKRAQQAESASTATVCYHLQCVCTSIETPLTTQRYAKDVKTVEHPQGMLLPAAQLGKKMVIFLRLEALQ